MSPTVNTTLFAEGITDKENDDPTGLSGMLIAVMALAALSFCLLLALIIVWKSRQGLGSGRGHKRKTPGMINELYGNLQPSYRSPIRRTLPSTTSLYAPYSPGALTRDGAVQNSLYHAQSAPNYIGQRAAALPAARRPATRTSPPSPAGVGAMNKISYDGAGILTLDKGGYGYAEVGGTGSYNRSRVPFETPAGAYDQPLSGADVEGAYDQPLSGADVAGAYDQPLSGADVEGAYDQPLGGPDVEEMYSVACAGQNNHGYLEVGGRRQTDVAI